MGQIASYVQQLVPDYFQFLQITTTNVLRDNNMVDKTGCNAVSVSPLCTIQQLKQQRKHSHCVGFHLVIQAGLVEQSAVRCNPASSVKPAKNKIAILITIRQMW